MFSLKKNTSYLYGPGNGSGVNISEGAVTMTNAVVRNNVYAGGALVTHTGSLTTNGCLTFSGNLPYNVAGSWTDNSTGACSGTIANTDTATGGCIAGSGADTITKSEAGTTSGTITLSAALPKIASKIVIEDGGHTISDNNSYRNFLGGLFTWQAKHQ